MTINEAPLPRAKEVTRSRIGASPTGWRFVTLMIVLMLVMIILPTAYAYLSAPLDRYFIRVMFNIPDHNH
jgi:hypothetical protein